MPRGQSARQTQEQPGVGRPSPVPTSSGDIFLNTRLFSDSDLRHGERVPEPPKPWSIPDIGEGTMETFLDQVTVDVDSWPSRYSWLGGDIQNASSAQDAWHEERISILESEVAALKEEVAQLRRGTEGEVVVLRTVDRAQAKQEIQEMFQSGETLFYSDIAARLGIDLALVVDLCQELQAVGEIEVNADAV